MLNRVEINEAISKEENIALILEVAQFICDSMFLEKKIPKISDYQYDFSEPIQELGLDKELIDHLIEDYISQIFKAYISFNLIIEDIVADGAKKEIAYKDLRNLAHKNLGVARNLRIHDSQILLTEIMNNNENIEHVKECVEALMACTFKLNPEYAFNMIKLKKVKEKL